MIDDGGAGARVLDANTKTTERGGGEDTDRGIRRVSVIY